MSLYQENIIKTLNPYNSLTLSSVSPVSPVSSVFTDVYNNKYTIRPLLLSYYHWYFYIKDYWKSERYWIQKNYWTEMDWDNSRKVLINWLRKLASIVIYLCKFPNVEIDLCVFDLIKYLMSLWIKNKSCPFKISIKFSLQQEC